MATQTIRNEGLVSTDTKIVQAGKSKDLTRRIVNIFVSYFSRIKVTESVPYRNLSESERARAENDIKTFLR